MSTYSTNLMINALTDAVSAAHAAGRIDDDTLASLFENEPESVVFYAGGDDEPWDEDDVAAISAVGERDASAKLAYWMDAVDELGRDRIAA